MKISDNENSLTDIVFAMCVQSLSKSALWQHNDAIGGEIKRIVAEGFGSKNDDVAFLGTEMMGL